jgi:DNA-binding MarR family transcriptional regulator
MSDAEISAREEVSTQQQLIEEQLEDIQLQIDRIRGQLLSPARSAGTADKSLLKVLVQEILRSRRRREKLFGGDLFGEPAWDILLELFSAELAQKKLSVSAACYASAVPHTTALRWLGKLEDDGWITRMDDPFDGRRSWLVLTDHGSDRMRHFLSNVAIRPIGNRPDCRVR